MKPQQPDPVKLLAGILYSDPDLLEKGLAALADAFGPVDFYSRPFQFDSTEYYTSEMGSTIRRVFVSFERLVSPQSLAHAKMQTNFIEEALSVCGARKVNIDSGIMDYDKVVLASAKYNGQKIYLDHGIWADLTLHFTKGRFEPYPWSFPDFKQGLYEDVFLEIRRIFKLQRRLLDRSGRLPST